MKADKGGLALSGVVKDVYGRMIGNLVGVILDLDGSVKSIGVNLGGGRFTQFSQDRIVERDHEFLVAPEWKVEIRSLVRGREARRRELALESMAQSNSANPRILEELKRNLQEIRSNQNSLKGKAKARLEELNANFEEVGEFEAMMKLQRATSEIDDRTYQVAADYCQLALSADAKERDELQRAIGFLENIDESPGKPAPASAHWSRAAPMEIEPVRHDSVPAVSGQDFPEFRLTPTAFRTL